jgi:hypothetical protein
MSKKSSNINWEPGMKDALKEAGKSGKERQRKIDELAKKGNLNEDGIEHLIKGGPFGNVGGSGCDSGGGCSGGY